MRLRSVRPISTWAIRRWRSAELSEPWRSSNRSSARPPRHAQEPHNLAEAYRCRRPDRRGDHSDEATLKARETKLGPDHPDTLISRNNLAVAYRSPAGPPRRSRCTRRRSSVESKLGPDHPDTLTSRNNLADAYVAAGRTAEAIECTRRRSSDARRSSAPTTPTRSSAAITSPSPTGPPAASPRRSRSTRRRSSCGVEARPRPPRHARQPQQPRHSLPGRRPHAEAIAAARGDAQGMRVEARPRPPRHAHQPQQPRRRLPGRRPHRRGHQLHEETLKAAGVEARPRPPRHARPAAATSPWPTRPPAGPPRPSSCTRRRSSCGRRSSAPTTPTRSPAATTSPWPTGPPAGPPRPSSCIEATLEREETKLGPDHPHTLTIRNNLLGLRGRRPDAEAKPLLRDALERARKRFGPADPRTAGAMAPLGRNLIQQRRWAEAEPVLRECLAIREKVQPDDWSTFNARCQLGGSLLGQKSSPRPSR